MSRSGSSCLEGLLLGSSLIPMAAISCLRLFDGARAGWIERAVKALAAAERPVAAMDEELNP